MFNRLKSLTGLAIVVLFAVFGPLHVADAGEIPIGAMFNVTGGMSHIGGPGMNGAELAVDLINKRGGLLRGRMVSLKGFDTKTRLDVCTSDARRLISERVVAALGYGDSDPAYIVGREFEKAEIPFVTSGATDPDLPARIGKYFFMAAYGDNVQAEAVADFAYDDKDVRSVAIWVNESSDFTKKFAGYFKQRFLSRGGKIVTEETYPKGEKDFSDLIDRLKSIKPRPDGLLVSAIPEDAEPSVSQVRRAGIEIPILSGDGFDSDIVERLGNKELADEVFFSTHSFRFANRPLVKEFKKAYGEKFGKAPENAFAALGYDAVNLIADAIQRTDSTDPRKIVAALAETKNFPAVTGTISYTSNSRVPLKPVAIIGILKGKYKLMKTWRPNGSSD